MTRSLCSLLCLSGGLLLRITFFVDSDVDGRCDMLTVAVASNEAVVFVYLK